MSSGSFQFRYNYTNENAAWNTNPNAKFILPEKQWKGALRTHITEAEKTE
jgi:hypothetical protein